MKRSPLGYIICESPTTAVDAKIITQRNDRVLAEGILQEGEERNRNGRCYATKELAGQVMAPRQQELISSGNMKGEAGHPTDKDITRQQTIDPYMVQVKYTKMWMDGNFVRAQFMGTNNALGEEFNKDLLSGEKPSFSLRALGIIEQTGGKAWVRNLKMITYDRVYFPSHPKAYTTGLVAESAIESGKKQNRIVVEEDYKGFITPITNADIISHIKNESCSLQTIMNNFDTLYESITLMENGRDVQLMDSNHDIIIVRLESYIQDEIMNYCYKTRR